MFQPFCASRGQQSSCRVGPCRFGPETSSAPAYLQGFRRESEGSSNVWTVGATSKYRWMMECRMYTSTHARSSSALSKSTNRKRRGDTDSPAFG